MSSPDWMPFYVDDYLGDTGELSTLEHGAYVLLILHYWKHRGLPNNDQRLARIARVSETDWAGMRDALAGHFKDGWQHTRIDAELAKADETIAKRKAAGVAGASARYGNRTAAASAGHKQTHAPLPEPLPEKVATQPSAREAEIPKVKEASKPPSLAIPVALRRGERTADWYDQIEVEGRAAAGLTEDPSPTLTDVSALVTLIDQGYDWSRDILPKLRAAHAADKHGRTWAYYVPAITEGKAANAKIPPKASQPAGTPTRWVPCDSPEWKSQAAAYRAQNGRDPPTTSGLGGSGWHFPVELAVQ